MWCEGTNLYFVLDSFFVLNFMTHRIEGSNLCGVCVCVCVCRARTRACVLVVCLFGWLVGWLVRWMDGWLVCWLHGWMDGWFDGYGWLVGYVRARACCVGARCIYVWVGDTWADGWVRRLDHGLVCLGWWMDGCGWMGGWMDGWMGAWIGERMDGGACGRTGSAMALLASFIIEALAANTKGGGVCECVSVWCVVCGVWCVVCGVVWCVCVCVCVRCVCVCACVWGVHTCIHTHALYHSSYYLICLKSGITYTHFKHTHTRNFATIS